MDSVCDMLHMSLVVYLCTVTHNQPTIPSPHVSKEDVDLTWNHDDTNSEQPQKRQAEL